MTWLLLIWCLNQNGHMMMTWWWRWRLNGKVDGKESRLSMKLNEKRGTWIRNSPFFKGHLGQGDNPHWLAAFSVYHLSQTTREHTLIHYWLSSLSLYISTFHFPCPFIFVLHLHFSSYLFPSHYFWHHFSYTVCITAL